MQKNKFFFAILILLFLSGTSFAQESTTENIEDDKIDAARLYNIATIQVLNKTTAKTSILKIKLGEKTKFERLQIVAHKCWQASLDQKPESKILLEVFEDKISGESKRIFYGWMFASSPSISGIEHPIYDIVALSCKNK